MATANGHFSSPFLVDTLFTPWFPSWPSPSASHEWCLLPREHPWAPAPKRKPKANQRGFPITVLCAFGGNPSYYAWKAFRLSMQCPSGHCREFLPLHKMPICLFAYGRNTKPRKVRGTQHNIKKVPTPKNSEKHKRPHYCRAVFILQLAHYFAKKLKESNKLFILSKQITEDLGTNKNVAEYFGGSHVETH